MSQAKALLASLTNVVHEHSHPVPDTDASFVIDPYSRLIENANYQKNVIMQRDHNSERFTFEIPRYVDGHDMSLCNRVIVHFDNISDDETTMNSDVAYMTDLQINPKNPETVISSWLITREATQIVGILSFSIQYLCVEADGTVSYEWSTDSFEEIEIRKSKNNGEASVVQYSNVLEQWRSELFSAGDSVMSNITTEGENQVAAVKNESATQQAAIELKGSETLATIPEDYTEVYNMAEEALRTKADGVLCEVEGDVIAINDSSDDYIRGLNLYGKSTQFTTTGKQLANNTGSSLVTSGITFISNADGSISISGTSTNDAYYLFDFRNDIPVKETELIASLSGGDGVSMVVGYFTEQDVFVNEITVVNSTVSKTFAYPAEAIATRTFLAVTTGKTINTTVYPLIRLATIEDASYEPYTGGLPTPNPEYPQEIVSVENPVVQIHNSNLMKYNIGYKGTQNGITCEYEGDGVYHIYGTYAGSNLAIQFADTALNIPIDRNAKYTLCAELLEGIPPDDFHPYLGVASESVSHRNWMAVSVDNRMSVGSIIHNTLPATHTLAEPTVINRFWIYAHNDTLEPYVADFRFRVWFTKSDIPMEYEPYSEQSIVLNHSLPGIPVTSDGNYTDSDGQQWICDEVDLERGVYIQRFKTIVLNGSPSEYYYEYHTDLEQGLSFVYVPHDGAMKRQSSMCDKYRNVNNSWEKPYFGQTGIYSDHNSVTSKYFRPPNDTVNSIDMWRTWLADNPLTLTYLLATPIETPLTAEEIETYKYLKTNYPNTTIFNDSGAMMKVKYNADTKLYISNTVETEVANVVEGVLNDTY